MKYCKKCVMPSTKPQIKFDRFGICEACNFHKKKNSVNSKGINWKKRNDEFNKLIKKIKSKKAPLYDVCVPVSGGKDSITQVNYLLNKGLRILCVNVDYGIKTEIGVKNLDLVTKMGAHLNIYRPSKILQRKIIKISFKDYGDPDLLSHCLVHGYPIRLAIQLNIPMVLLGENSAYEYSGEKQINEKKMSDAYFKYYAYNSGITPKQFGKKYNIDYKHLIPYELPKKNLLKKTNAVFSSYFFNWSSEKNLKIANKYGFKSLKKPGEGTYRNYVGIDEKINRVHQYLKLLKFGYGRGTDHACEDIRNKKISRIKAINLVKKYDRVPLSEYFVKDFCAFLKISKKDFYKVLNKYTNKKIWNFKNNKPIIKKDNLK